MKNHNLSLTFAYLFTVLFLLCSSFSAAYSATAEIDTANTASTISDTASVALPVVQEPQAQIPTVPSGVPSQPSAYTLAPNIPVPNVGPNIAPNAWTNTPPWTNSPPNVAPYADVPSAAIPAAPYVDVQNAEVPSEPQIDTPAVVPSGVVDSANLESESTVETTEATESTEAVDAEALSAPLEAKQEASPKLPPSASFTAQARVAAVIHSNCNNGNCTGCSTVPFNSRGHTAQSLCCLRGSNRPGCN